MVVCNSRSLSSSILLVFLFCFFSFSHGVPHLHALRSPSLSSGELIEEAKYVAEITKGTLRTLLQEVPPGNENSSLVLAAERTYRKDPLNDFKRYTGGWNIDDRHYWASVSFTAAPLFLIAAVWFLGFGLCLMLICLCHFCCTRQSYGYSRIAYALSLVFLILFTIAAIVGCVVLYTGQGKFHNTTTKTLDYVVNQADSTVKKLNEVSGYLGSAKQTGVNKVFLPSNVQTDIDNIEAKIDSSASNLSNQTSKNSQRIRDLLDSVRMALIVIAAVMLLLTFLGFLFSLFGLKFLVYLLVIIGWILVAGTFILCGIFLLLHNVTADTCVAMNQYVQHPAAHTALDKIIPCVDNATAQETLMRTKEVSSQLVEVINTVISNVSNINFAPNFVPMYFNQSGPLVPKLCNPFRPDLTNRVCSAGEVDYDNATQVWKTYVCQVSASGICTTTGRLTPSMYDQIGVAFNLSYGLYNYGPFLVSLQDCTFVRQTFTDIYRDHCPDLRHYSRYIYIGLVMVSAAVMLSLVFWVIYGRERRHRVYTKNYDRSHEENKATT
ncbi:hypothetical protein EZV62_013582 [Acer yangbiense]|uniref:Transmembrane protein n=1 Tax=Acer yangbiense TaxID=1000413 RepID=A0A5C7HZV9_9ROSI|nr:hypothetical protein EZV62_013582 [Acer yangbiense]